MCVLKLLYIGTQADDAVISDASSFAYTAYAGLPPHTTTYVSSYCYICVLILLHMCAHTAIYVSSYYCTCVFMLLYMCLHTSRVMLRTHGPRTRASAYDTNTSSHILLYMCPHTTISVSSYYYISSSFAYTAYARVFNILLFI